MGKQILRYGILIGLVIAITAFIFSNSFADHNESHSTSDAVSEIILPNKNVNEAETAGLAVRKAAHLVEYTMLGIAATLIINRIARDYGRSAWGFGFFYVLAVAVTDEHIQSFSGRTSSTADIILDFCGGLIGFFAGWITVLVYMAIKHRYNKRKRQRR